MYQHAPHAGAAAGTVRHMQMQQTPRSPGPHRTRFLSGHQCQSQSRPQALATHSLQALPTRPCCMLIVPPCSCPHPHTACRPPCSPLLHARCPGLAVYPSHTQPASSQCSSLLLTLATCILQALPDKAVHNNLHAALAHPGCTPCAGPACTPCPQATCMP